MTCDYCDEGNLPIEGWHEIVDPEGVEGLARVPCANRQAEAEEDRVDGQIKEESDETATPG